MNRSALNNWAKGLSPAELDNYRRGNATKDEYYRAAMREVKRRGRCRAVSRDGDICERVPNHPMDHEQTKGLSRQCWNYDVRQVLEENDRLRNLAASGMGPATTNRSTGADDFDIVCNGCGEAVPEPHTWAKCCAAQRKRVEHLCGELAAMGHERDESKAVSETLEARCSAGDKLRNQVMHALLGHVVQLPLAQSIAELYARDKRRNGLLDELRAQLDSFREASNRKHSAGRPGEQQERESDLVKAMERVVCVALRIEWYELHPDKEYTPPAKATRPDTPNTIETAKVVASVVGGACIDGDG